MSEISDILNSGQSQRLPSEAVASPDLRALPKELQDSLPPEYVEFLNRNGLAELRLCNRVLGPADILAESQWVEDLGLLPMASDGCGNLYCWRIQDLPQSAVLLWNHDSGEVEDAFPTFVEALQTWRF
jgi:hypothetical protein